MTTIDIDAARAELAQLDEDKRLPYAVDLAGQLGDVQVAQLVLWQNLLCGKGLLGKRQFNALHKDAVARHRAAEDDARALRAEEMLTGGDDPAVILPGPDKPMAAARKLVEMWPNTDGVPHVAWWRGDYYRYSQTHWTVLEDSVITQDLYRSTEHALYAHPKEGFVPWDPNRRSVGDLSDALAKGVVQRDPGTDDDRCIACANGVLDLDTMDLMVHHPRRFNLTSLPYDYDPDATCPQWLAFLASVLPAQDERDMLQEWFGYVASGRTDLQKMLHMFGAPRSGKGTIIRIMEALIGGDAVTSPTLQSLAGQFGEQQLIGKTLAVMSDISWEVRDAGTSIEVLKSISGEDSREVNRKNRPYWHGKLGVRFVLSCNDTPKLKDASGALVSRMLHLEFKISFLGREDSGLTDRLMAELSGILNWALAGLKRLNQQGRFSVTESSHEAENQINRENNHVFGFVEDQAYLDANAPRRLLDDVHRSYLAWCERANRKNPLTLEVFSRDLRSAGQGRITIERKRLTATEGGDGKQRVRWVYGLAEIRPGALTETPRWGQ